jgi:hypothetical protein
LFTKKIGNDIFICQIYVDDIIFGSTNEYFCKEFGEMMSRQFKMSMIGELSIFLGLKIKQLKEGTFVCQSKYVKDICVPRELFAGALRTVRACRVQMGPGS